MLFESQFIVFWQLLLAAFLGALVGTERVAAGKSAGSRTFALISLTTCLFAIISTQVDAHYLGLVNFEPLQLVGAAITGIGFLGGGLIFMQGKALQGLTTAAGVWAAAGIGMAVGFGFYEIALFTSCLVLLIFTLMWFAEEGMRHVFTKVQPLMVGRMIDSDGDSMPDSEEKLPPIRSEA